LPKNFIIYIDYKLFDIFLLFVIAPNIYVNDYDVISKLLGHMDIKTTKIYTKYETSYLNKEMNKWNK
jgi:integrase